MRLLDAFGRSKGAVNLVRVSVIEELMEECRVDSFICVFYAVISFPGWKCGNCTGNSLDFHTKEANPMEMISKAAKQPFAWAEWDFFSFV